MLLDDVTQVAERNEFLYHEPMVSTLSLYLSIFFRLIHPLLPLVMLTLLSVRTCHVIYYLHIYLSPLPLSHHSLSLVLCADGILRSTLP